MENKTRPETNLKSLAITLLVGVIIWFIPTPSGVSGHAWQLLAIFVATILGLIIKPLPLGGVAIVGITMTALTGTLSISQSLSGFSNSTIWLIVSAFFISRGFIKTGLGRRIAYLLMARLGKSSLGLCYGISLADLILAPAIPSNTARCGGIIYPLLASVAKAYGSDPEQGTERKLGAFLIKSAYQVNMITSAMFMTAMAANPLAVKLASDQQIQISWGSWAIAAAVPGIVSLLTLPLLLYKLYPPQIRATPQAAQIAHDKLKEMGSVSTQEWVMLGVFVLLLVLWIGGSTLGIHSTTAALTGLAILMLCGTLSWTDIIQEKGAWTTLIWFSALVMMADYLNKLGLIGWFTHSISGSVNGLNWELAFLILALVYLFSHYLFASSTAHVAAMYGAFLSVSIAVGTPPMLAALVLAFFSNLMGSLTHYGSGPAPVLFGSNHVAMKHWWGLGLLCALVNILIWLVIGGSWWRVLGLW
ncbi:anion permease [Dongshaea marina]|uniref:anion permease n=1 Tax=Dongshaea marina TaxID=2047966 RepID=UPI000D3E828C|nr:anion permease [Dongshaea marina]